MGRIAVVLLLLPLAGSLVMHLSTCPAHHQRVAQKPDSASSDAHVGTGVTVCRRVCEYTCEASNVYALKIRFLWFFNLSAFLKTAAALHLIWYSSKRRL